MKENLTRRTCDFCEKTETADTDSFGMSFQGWHDVQVHLIQTRNVDFCSKNCLREYYRQGEVAHQEKEPYIPSYIYKGHPSFETIDGEEHLSYNIASSECVLRVEDGFKPQFFGYGEVHGDMNATYYLFKKDKTE